MSCRRICRELLSQARFGEFGPGAAPHLEHLTDCRACRDELGFDRALVRQLRTALADRVAGVAPSPQAWEGILQRMARPDPPSRVRAWSMMLVARLRVGSAMAGGTLAVLVALNFDVVPVRPSDALHDGGVLPSASAPPRPLDLADGFAQAAGTSPDAVGSAAAAEEAEPVAFTSRGVWVEHPEELPILGARRDATNNEPAAEPTDGGEPSRPAGQPLTVRLVPADAAVVTPAAEPTTARGLEPRAEPAPSPAPAEGTPS